MSAHMIVWGERSEQTQAVGRWISGLLQTPPLLLRQLRAQELDILNNGITGKPYKNVSVFSLHKTSLVFVSMSAHIIVWGECSEQTGRWTSGLLQTPPLLLRQLRAQELDILNNGITGKPYKNVSVFSLHKTSLVFVSMSAHIIVWGECSEQTGRWTSGLLQTPPLLLRQLRVQELDILNDGITGKPFQMIGYNHSHIDCRGWFKGTVAQLIILINILCRAFFSIEKTGSLLSLCSLNQGFHCSAFQNFSFEHGRCSPHDPELPVSLSWLNKII